MGELIPKDILDDLSSRFLINLPEEECTDPVRLFFQIELAHWYYLDFHRVENPQLKSCGMKEFTKHILKHIPIYSSLLQDFDNYYDQWKGYKMAVPTFGAIVLNEDMTKVLLVQSFFEKTSWGFPKGKINFEENPVKCATREVFEEIGCDISHLIKEEEFIETFWCEQMIRLYVVAGVKETERFEPQTRNEIKNIKWFAISDLPTSKKDVTPKIKIGVRTNSFFMVLPFMKRLKAWIQEKKSEDGHQPVNKRKQRHKSVGDASHTSPSPGNQPKNKRHSNNFSGMTVDFQGLNLNSFPVAQPSKSDNAKLKTALRKKLFSDNGKPPDLRDFEYSFDPKNVHIYQPEIIVPRWLDFKLKREPLLRCFDF